jgi:hypothetical protein
MKQSNSLWRRALNFLQDPFGFRATKQLLTDMDITHNEVMGHIKRAAELAEHGSFEEIQQALDDLQDARHRYDECITQRILKR